MDQSIGILFVVIDNRSDVMRGTVAKGEEKVLLWIGKRETEVRIWGSFKTFL